MTAQHTPGEGNQMDLTVTRHATPDHCPQFGIYDAKSENAHHDIATVHNVGGHDETLALANLFAAAPEMWAVCDELANGEVTPDTMNALIERARAAIAKAEGRA